MLALRAVEVRIPATGGTIAGCELTPAKARILLMLTLQETRRREAVRPLFDAAGAP